jgi:hypothetical protein
MSRKKTAMRCPVHGRKMKKRGCPECARPGVMPGAPGALGAAGEGLVSAAKARHPEALGQIDYLAGEYCSPDGARRVGAQQALYKLAWGQDVIFK